MKILLTGGGTGGHFYPLIAIAEKLTEVADKEKIVDLKMYYMSDSPYDKRLLFENNITYVQVPAGKMRLYFSFSNIIDIFKTAIGAFLGLLSTFFIYPDVIISKGGYAAFPACFAGKILGIPVIIHESDSSVGRMNLWTAKFAKYIAISWSEAIEQLPKEKTALTGQPIRKEILHANPEGAFEFFKLDSSIPTIFVVGGSLGADIINNSIIQILPDLVSKYQVIHQTGRKNIEDTVARSHLVLENNPNANRYIPIAYMNNLTTRMAAGASTLIVSRAGSMIFEIASWGKPSIIIPITNSNGDHQRKNAYNYARHGTSIVIEENNLIPHVLFADIDKLISNKEKLQNMSDNALKFASHDASEIIARKAIEIALSHDNQ